VSERERLSITYQYCSEVTGDQLRAADILQVWRQTFPNDFRPVNSLTVIDNFLGRFDRAVEEGTEAVRRNPSHGFPYSNLAHAYRGLGRFDRARETAEQAVSLKIETLVTRRLLYQLAVVAGDEEAANRQVLWARDNAREFDMVGVRAQAAAFAGRLTEARGLFAEASRMAETMNLPDVGAGYLASAMSIELAYGNVETARQMARRILARSPSEERRLRAALALATTGSTAEAEAIVDDLTRAHPQHTVVNLVLAPMVRAAVELRRRRPERA